MSLALVLAKDQGLSRTTPSSSLKGGHQLHVSITNLKGDSGVMSALWLIEHCITGTVVCKQVGCWSATMQIITATT